MENSLGGNTFRVQWPSWRENGKENTLNILLNCNVYLTSNRVKLLMPKWCEKWAIKVEVTHTPPPLSPYLSHLRLCLILSTTAVHHVPQNSGDICDEPQLFLYIVPPNSQSPVRSYRGFQRGTSQAEISSCKAEVIDFICMELIDVTHVTTAECVNDTFCT